MAIFPIRINELNFERKLIIKLSNLVKDGHIYQMNDNLTNETAPIIKMKQSYNLLIGCRRGSNATERNIVIML
ncbi:hypothetical protein QQG55_6970 [Brugia pahangi]